MFTIPLNTTKMEPNGSFRGFLVDTYQLYTVIDTSRERIHASTIIE